MTNTMTSFIQKLKLPSTPLREGVLDDLVTLKQQYHNTLFEFTKKIPQTLLHHYVESDIEKYICPNLLNIFDSLGTKVEYFVLFGQTTPVAYTCPIHVDLNSNQGNKPVPGAINWELATPGVTWQWWDTQGECPLPDVQSARNAIISKYTLQNSRNMLAGSRYGYSGEFDEDLNKKFGFKPIASHTLEKNTAYLVRTDMPHTITNTETDTVRITISLRFSPKDVSTWEEAVEKFSSLQLATVKMK